MNFTAKEAEARKRGQEAYEKARTIRRRMIIAGICNSDYPADIVEKYVNAQGASSNVIKFINDSYEFGQELRKEQDAEKALAFINATEIELFEFRNSPFLRARTRDACNPTSTNSYPLAGDSKPEGPTS